MSSAASYWHLLPLLVAVVSCGTSRPEFQTAARAATAASSSPWLQYTDVRQAGFDGQALRAGCERADSLHSGAAMAVFRGRVILACGDVVRKFEAHSVRKSLVSGLYGTAVARGEIDLDSTLADFAIARRPCASEDGYDIRTVQELLGHSDVSTTMVYTHVLNRGPLDVRNPGVRL